MCLLAILYRMFDEAPVVLLANREEEFARGGSGLDLRSAAVPFVAGLDPAAGGTWLGVNAAGLIVAVTNRPKSDLPPEPRSRGLLVRDLLGGMQSASEGVRAAARELGTGHYAGCNIVCADAESLGVVHGGDWLRVRNLSPGIHLVTNGDVNDPSDERIRWIGAQLQSRRPGDPDEALTLLRSIACHTGPPVPICFRRENRGTVASTLLSWNIQPRRRRLFHANGSPADTPYVDRTDLLWELASIMEKKQR